MSSGKKTAKVDLAHSHSGGRLVGGRLSEIATYSDLFLRTRDAIFFLDPKGLTILECNPSVQQLLGAAPDRLEGDQFLNWVHPSSQDAAKRHLARGARAKRAETPFDCEMGNGMIFELSVCGLRLADYDEVLQVIAKDVTEMRLARQELEEMNRKLEAVSITDEMTQVSNFRHFMRELEREHERSARYDGKYAVIFCDVDHFKHYNDTQGHPAGDEVLKSVAHILRDRTRKTDLCARYGGEEFVVLCPGTDARAARQLAETLRAAIAGHVFPSGEKQPLGRVTISLGVASFPEHGGNWKQVLQAADEGVYESKRQGRNRVSLSGDAPVSRIPRSKNKHVA
ncbi:MAG: diguanylate cyclase [Bacteriovoracia bacterium]